MSMTRILGITILVVGVILLVVGMNASDSAVDQLSDTLTGSFTDRTMWYLIGGAGGIVGGGLLAAFGKGR